MSEDDVKAIAAALEGSTPGAWTIGPSIGVYGGAATILSKFGDLNLVIAAIHSDIYKDRDDARLIANAPDWLRQLLQERARLLDVMRGIVHDAEHDHHLATNWATERLKAALVTLEGE